MGKWVVLFFFSVLSTCAMAAANPLREKLLVDILQDKQQPRSERTRAAGELAELAGMNSGYQALIADTVFSALRDRNVALRLYTIDVVKKAVTRLGPDSGDLLIVFKRTLCNDREERVRAHSLAAIHDVALSRQSELQHKLFASPEKVKAARKFVLELIELLSRAALNDSSPRLRQRAQSVELELAKLIEIAVACDAHLKGN